MIALLVASFGEEAVRQAMANAGQFRAPRNGKKSAKHPNGKHKRAKAATFVSVHDDLPEMRQFLTGVEHGTILPDIEDIRRLATFAGLKGLAGRNRRDLLRSLLRFLDSLSNDKLLPILHEAEIVSSAHHRDGLALLTNKILEGVSSDQGELAKGLRRQGY